MSQTTGSSESQKIRLCNPFFPRLDTQIRNAALRDLPEIEEGGLEDRPGALIVGTGPSLVTPEVLDEIRELDRAGWFILAIKEAIRVLRQKGIRVDASCSMDPKDDQVPKTPIEPGVTYYVASSCHETLFDHLLSHGMTVVVFHSACGACDPVTGVPGRVDIGGSHEEWLYQRYFKSHWVACGGYTVLNRAVHLVEHKGAKRIVCAGADFGWRDGSSYYSAGVHGKAGNKGPDLCDEGKTDGNPWHTRTDILASGLAIARALKAGRIERILGDSMATALSKQSDEFLKQIIKE